MLQIGTKAPCFEGFNGSPHENERLRWQEARALFLPQRMHAGLHHLLFPFDVFLPEHLPVFVLFGR